MSKAHRRPLAARVQRLGREHSPALLHLIAEVKKEGCYSYDAHFMRSFRTTRKAECFSVTLYSGFEIQRSVDIGKSDLFKRIATFEETIQACRGHTYVGTRWR